MEEETGKKEMEEKETAEREAAEKETEGKEEVEEGVHNYSRADRYVWPKEPAVRQQLEWFQDQKLALMMHWGPYCQLGLVESWALSDHDAGWSRSDIDWVSDGEAFKRQYRDLNKTFNPLRFEPEKWAQAAKEGGFKYFIFTTKHHDGFCMWDTKYSDYKITSPDCPFHTHRYADVCRNLFEAMRNKGLGIAAYFSKADWHVPCYWNDSLERGSFTWRGPSYDPKKHPELWEEFVQFTHNQVMELATGYGKLDVLWFDAGWVCERAGEDIRLGELMDKVRQVQPWVLSADRTVGGPYENYVTPEQCVPEKPLGIPWESCITMGTAFSFRYEDDYKSMREIACLLMDIVAKGGNLALNVAPQPDGRLPRRALANMKELGEWLKVYGEGIYGTRVCAPYKKDGICFTQKEKEGLVYAFRMYPDEHEAACKELFLPYEGAVQSIRQLGTEGEAIFEKKDGGYLVKAAAECGTPVAQAFVLTTA